MFAGKRQRYLAVASVPSPSNVGGRRLQALRRSWRRSDRRNGRVARRSACQAGAGQVRCHFSRGPSQETCRVLRKGHKLPGPAGSVVVVFQ